MSLLRPRPCAAFRCLGIACCLCVIASISADSARAGATTTGSPENDVHEFSLDLNELEKLLPLMPADVMLTPMDADGAALESSRQGVLGPTSDRHAVIPLPPGVYLGLTGFAFVVSMKYVRKLLF